MAEELVVDAQLVEGDIEIRPPQVNTTSLTRLDEAVDRIEAAAQTYVCLSAEDYAASARDIANIRKLTTMYEQIFAPMKSWWNARLTEVRSDETARTGRLDAAKRLRERKMLTWKSAEDQRKAELQRQQDALERKRAEDRRLAEAEKIAERGRVTNNPKLEQAAVDLLDRPLDIAPTQVASTVPQLGGTGVHTVKRKVLVAKQQYARLKAKAVAEHRLMTDQEWREASDINGPDLEELIICIAASLLLQRGPLAPEVQAFLQPLATKIQESQKAIKAVDSAWIKREYAQRGDTFALGGVEIVVREGLG